MNLDDFIWISEDKLSEDFCEHCIEKFNKDPSRYQGQIGMGEVKLEIKQSIDLTISDPNTVSNWKEEDKIFFDSLHNALKLYKEYVPEEMRKAVLNNNTQDCGYQIQRTEPGGFYHWHQDQIDNRKLTYIWYLNDVVEDGYTEFITGKRVQPKRGRMMIFPALWPWVHRGYPPKSEIKYIVTGWTTSD